MTLNLGKLVRVQWEMAELSRELIGREGIGECSHDHILYCLNPEVGSGLQVHKPYVLPGNWNCLKLTTQRSCHWIPGPVFLLSWLLCRRGRGVTGSELRRFISPSSSGGRSWNSIDLWGDRVIPLQGKCFFFKFLINIPKVRSHSLHFPAHLSISLGQNRTPKTWVSGKLLFRYIKSIFAFWLVASWGHRGTTVNFGHL